MGSQNITQHENGLYKISAAPALSARFTRSSTLQSVVHPVFMTTGILRVDIFLFNCAVTSSPFSPGRRTSIMIRSGCTLEALSRASKPVAASTTSWPKPFINARSDSRKASLLSTINIFLAVFRIEKIRSTTDASRCKRQYFGIFSRVVSILRYSRCDIRGG
jgi:hypothetical protein